MKTRLSADDKARIAFTHDRLARATQLALFARRAGRVSKKTLETISALKRDHERAIEGKKVPAFDALGGRGKWTEAQKEKAA